MIPISGADKTALASPSGTYCTIWLVTRTDSQVFGFTDHDDDVTIGTQLYQSAVGYTRSDIEGHADLSVDNLENIGVLSSPAITEADLHAGVWDFAAVVISLCDWSDPPHAVLILRNGKLGEVTVDRGYFRAELRGMTQAYTRVIGELTSPMCRNDLGDARCTVDLTPFTVTGSLTGVNPDNQTLYDTARTEPGPTGGVSITAVSKANPGVVTLAAGMGLPDGTPVTISACTGMTDINAVTLYRSPNEIAHTFQLGIDTTSYPAYTGSGICTPLGGDTGYFDFGVITFTSGNNVGLSMEVRCYVPGQITLQLPMPYQCQVGDAYTMHAGCDKSVTTCHDRFSNVVNFRGEPYLPGIDKIMQTGKQ